MGPRKVPRGHSKVSLKLCPWTSPVWTPVLSICLHRRGVPALWSFLSPTSGCALANFCLYATDPRAGHSTLGGISPEWSRAAESSQIHSQIEMFASSLCLCYLGHDGPFLYSWCLCIWACFANSWEKCVGVGNNSWILACYVRTNPDPEMF